MLILPAENWPDAIKQVKNDSLLMQSLGAAVSYFEELNFANEIVPVANYFHYDPNNQTKYLILDYVSLSNLEILQNNDTGSTEGSLLHTLNHCVTPFGIFNITLFTLNYKEPPLTRVI